MQLQSILHSSLQNVWHGPKSVIWLDPSLQTNKPWHVFMGMKQKEQLSSKRFQTPWKLLKKYLNHYHRYTNHCEFLEYWNAQKSIWRIWECFSHLLDKRIPKIWKKLNPHDGFLSYLHNSTANSAHLAAHFCPALVCPQKATVRIQFLLYFWNPLIK